ncbi:MAG: hypothetical protein KDF65_13415, partial [Anaerolineae bacterium]|nr:hypothetical protein [Anaerolineae bacterium]
MSSAIVALIHWNNQPVDPVFLTAANRCVQYRCPDGAWQWAAGPVGMAQADLATLPEDDPGVPVSSERFRIVADCRLDNRDEIFRTLPSEFKPRQNSDAAFILAAYAAWGGACVDHLLGDFAFVIWDIQQQTLFAARDTAGARPLYYFEASDRLILVSELTQAFQNGAVPLEINEEHIVEYLTPQFQGAMGWELGWFKGFQVLPVGHTLQAQTGHIQVRSYWDWRDYPLEECSEKDAIEEYRSLLTEAVACRLRSRHAVAFELSGGLD